MPMDHNRCEVLIDVLYGRMGVVYRGDVHKAEGLAGWAAGDEGFEHVGHLVDCSEFEDCERGGQISLEEAGEDLEAAFVYFVLE